MTDPSAVLWGRRKSFYAFLCVQALGSAVVVVTGEPLLPLYLVGLALLLPGSGVAAGITWALATIGFGQRFRYFWDVADAGYLLVSVAANLLLFVLVVRHRSSGHGAPRKR